MSKKLLVWLLTLCMMLSLAVVAVSAEEAVPTEPEAQPNTVWYGTKTQYDEGCVEGNTGTIYQAIVNASTSETTYIKLLGNVTTSVTDATDAGRADSDGRMYPDKKKIVLDFNGYQLLDGKSNFDGTMGDGVGFFFQVMAGGEFTLTDSYKGTNRVGGAKSEKCDYGIVKLQSSGKVVFGPGKYEIGAYVAAMTVADGGTVQITSTEPTFNTTRGIVGLYGVGSKMSLDVPATMWDGMDVYFGAIKKVGDVTYEAPFVSLKDAFNLPSGYDVAQYGTTTLLVGAEHTFSTSYEIKAVNQITAAATNGIVEGVGSYVSGTTATLVAVPSSWRYVFDHWEENGQPVAGAGAEYTFTVTGDRSLTAVFRDFTDSDIPEGSNVVYRVDGGDWTFGTLPADGSIGSGIWRIIDTATSVDPTQNELVLLTDIETARINAGGVVDFKFTIDLNGHTLTAYSAYDAAT